MCTVTWLVDANAYTVFFNRDELKTRSRALPPSVNKQGGVRYVAPADLDGGGTWLGVNEFGVTCGVLNNYFCSSSLHGQDILNLRAPEDATTKYSSRGLVTISLLGSPTIFEALRRLDTIGLSKFRPFLLIIFAPDHPVASCTWDGEVMRIQTENVEMPVSSSSFDTNNVVQNRKREFESLKARNRFLDSGLLESYHAGHSPKGGAYSVCVHRDDAETVSFSRIHVTPEQINFHYSPGSPCVTKESVTVVLERTRFNSRFANG